MVSFKIRFTPRERDSYVHSILYGGVLTLIGTYWTKEKFPLLAKTGPSLFGPTDLIY